MLKPIAIYIFIFVLGMLTGIAVYLVPGGEAGMSVVCDELSHYHPDITLSTCESLLEEG